MSRYVTVSGLVLRRDHKFTGTKTDITNVDVLTPNPQSEDPV